MADSEAYNLICDHFPAGILLENHGTIEYANLRIAELLGYNRQELCGQPLTMLLNPADNYYSTGRLFSEAPQSLNHELTLHGRGGENIVVLAHVLPTRYADNSPMTIYVEERSGFLTSDAPIPYSLVDEAAEAIIITSLEGSILVWNHAAAALYGYSHTEVHNRSISIIIPPDLNHHLINKLLQDERVDKVQTLAWSKQGQLLNIELSLSPVRDQHGNISRVAFFCRDLTQEMVSAKRMRYQSRLLEAVNDAIVVAEYNGSITYWNQGAERLFGRKAEEVLGKKYSLLFDSGELKDVYTLMDEVQPGIWQGRRLVRTPQGENKYVQLSVRVLYDETEQPDLLVAVMTDVTELVAARLKAEEAVRARGEFLANISHEIRTPINGILGFSELLEDKELPLEQKAHLKSIKSNAAQLLELINDILDLSRIEANSMTVDQFTFNLRNLVDQTCQNFGPLLQEKGLGLSITYPPDTPEFFTGDNKRIRQVLNNLLSNAVKFTARGAIHVQVFIAPNSGHKTSVTISVTDTGIGISADRLHYVFEPFTQADSSTTRRYGGTGLGLAICKRLVELMRGRFDVESTPGRGSRFAFTLPLETAGQRPSLQSAVQKQEPSGFRILLLSPDPSLQKQWHGCLKRIKGELVTPDNEHRLAASIDFYQPRAVLVDDRVCQANVMLLKQQLQTARNKLNFLLLLISDDEHHQAVQILCPDRILKRSMEQEKINLLLDEMSRQPPEHSYPHQPMHVLVAVDNSLNQKLIQNILNTSHYRVSIVNNLLQAQDLMSKQPVDLLLLEMDMMIMEEFQSLTWIQENFSRVPIIGMRSDAIHSHSGVHYYIDKPVTTHSLLDAVNRQIHLFQRG